MQIISSYFWYFKYICDTNIVFHADVNIALERTLKLKFKTTGSSSCKFVDDFVDTWSEVTAIGGLPPLVYASATKHDILLRFPIRWACHRALQYWNAVYL